MGVYIPAPAGVNSPGVAPDGLRGQYLRKASDLDYDTEWVDVEISSPGSSAPVYAIRTDAATPGTVYVGRASVGSSEAATVWTIRRRTFSAAGVLLTTSTATGAWSNRTNLTYT